MTAPLIFIDWQVQVANSHRDWLKCTHTHFWAIRRLCNDAALEEAAYAQISEAFHYRQTDCWSALSRDVATWPHTVCAGTMQQTSLFFHQLIKGHIMKIMEIHGLI